MRTDAICLSFSRQFLRCLPRFATQVNRFADSDVSRAPEAQRMSFVTVTLQRTLARVPRIFTFPHHRKRHGRHGGHLPQARVQPLPVRPRLHRAVHTVRHTPPPSPSLGNAPVAHGLPISRRGRLLRRACRERATRRIDGARRGCRFFAGVCARSARLRPRPSQTRRVTHGAVGRSSVARHARSFRRAAKRRAAFVAFFNPPVKL